MSQSKTRTSFRAVAWWPILVLLAAEGVVRAAGWMLVRERDWSQPPPGVGVIYAIGDSFTYGQGVAPEQAWPRVLAAHLRTEIGDAAPEVRMLAEPGRSSSIAMLEAAQALKAGDARMLLVMTGWNANDGDFAALAAEQNRPVPWTARADLALSHSRLYRLVKQAVTYRSRTLVLDNATVIPQTTQMRLYDFQAYQRIARANLQRIARMCHAASVPCVLITYPHQDLPPNPYTRTEYYHTVFGRTPLSEADYLVHDRLPGEIAIDAIIRWVGETEDLPVVDMQAAFERSRRKDLFLSDWHHPTAAGHAIMADILWAAIRERLRHQ